ncbi:MlaD family protein [Actinomadura kijaniata]|uniref:MlaD family protein n=1 Tax=Actinomadura kijaniata TaxID=46161 RepID=UPI000832460A|nr:MlaD family protein [Actinomadura kijaniata]
MADSGLSARSRTRFALLGTVAIAGAATAVAFPALPANADTTYNAVFGRAGQGLDARSDIKVRGVTVGRVESVGLNPDGRVRVRMRVGRDVRVPRDAEARVDPVSVFGPKEITLELGRGSGPYLAEGGTVTRTRDAADPADTARPAYEFGRVVDPQDVATLAHTFARGLDNQGPALRRAVDNGAKVVDATHRRRAELRRLTEDLAGLSGTLGDRGDTVVGVARDADALAPLATGAPDRVTRLLDEAGRLSTRVGGTLQRQGGNLGGLVDDTAPYARLAAGHDRELLVLLDSLTGFFDGLASVMTAPGPNGTRPAVLRGTLPLDACKIAVDVCG